jgi:sortase A
VPVFVLIAGVVLAAAVASGGVAQTTDPGWSVTAVSSTSGVVDGKRVTLNVRSNAENPITRVEVRQCRLGPAYATASDLAPTAGNCPGTTISTSSDLVVVRTNSSKITEASQTPSGATVNFKIGVGVASWVPGPGVPETSLTCDPTHDCALVVQVRVGLTPFHVVFPLQFVDADPIAGCGGPAAGVVQSVGADRMVDVWTGWTRDFCARALATGAPTRSSFGAEGTAVRSFADGSADLAYTALGFNDAAGLGPTDPTLQRQAVATPLNLNAAVIAVGGGHLPLTGDKAPYPELELTAAEVSAIFGGGTAYVNRTDLSYIGAILARNPVLNGHLFSIAPVVRPLAHSDSQSSSWYMTNFLTEQSPADWIAPRADPVAPRGATTSIALAEPPFLDLESFTGRPALEKFTEQAANSLITDGGVWAITDLVTARALGMTPVSIETAPGSGQFVAPTPESMAAAVATMQPDSHGLLQPDLSLHAAAEVGATATPAYPLTFVEYALAAAEPLHDATTCALRVDSQSLLTNWLTYATTEGQSQLPVGAVPLPPALAAEAASAVQRVGASAMTGACAPSAIPSGGNPSGAPGAVGSLGAGAPFGATGAPTSRSSLPVTAGTGSDSAANAAAEQARILVPAFAGHQLANPSDGMLALLGIVVITSLAAWLTSGRRAGDLAFVSHNSGAAPPPIHRPPGMLALLWVGVALAGVGLVVYQLGPILAQRDQRDLLSEYRNEVRQSANATQGLQGAETPTEAPEAGAPVGVLEVGALQLQGVVIEGASPSETQVAPGHVPGTAGLGQPGNSVVVGRRNGFGGEFAELEQLRRGDKIVVTTTQGQSVYKVTSTRTRTVVDEGDSTDTSSAPDGTAKEAKTGEAADPTATTAPTSSADTAPTSQTETETETASTSDKATGAAVAGTKAASATPVTLEDLYGPSDDDRLTLVTSASRAPWNASDATVVTAKLQGLPFEPTPQGGRNDASTGRGGDAGVWPAVALVGLAYGVVIAASVVLYRRMQFRVAYVLTIAPLVALTVLAGDTLSRLLPAWM